MKYATILSGLLRFDAGTQYTLSPACGLVRGNIQWPRTIGLSTESKISGFNFLEELKLQAIQYRNDSLRLSINSILKCPGSLGLFLDIYF